MRKKIISIIAPAAFVAASIVSACNVTVSGPCHTATSNTHNITCLVGTPGDIMWEGTFSVTDTTGDGNRVIHCETASTGLDGVKVGPATCYYDYTTYVCSSIGLGPEPDSGTKSFPTAYCGARGNACPGG